MSNPALDREITSTLALNVMIAKAKRETADRLGIVITTLSLFAFQAFFHSWVLGVLAAGVAYWMTTRLYTAAYKKARADYTEYTGVPPAV